MQSKRESLQLRWWWEEEEEEEREGRRFFLNVGWCCSCCCWCCRLCDDCSHFVFCFFFFNTSGLAAWLLPSPLPLLALRVIVTGRPARVQLHVDLPLFAGQLIVLGLLVAAQRVPLFAFQFYPNNFFFFLRFFFWSTRSSTSLFVWVVPLLFRCCCRCHVCCPT